MPLTAVSGQQGQKKKPKPNNQTVLAPFVLQAHCGLALTARTLTLIFSCKRHTHHSPPILSPLLLRSRCVAVRSLWQLQLQLLFLPLPFSSACTARLPAPTCLQPAPAPNFSRLFLDCVPPFPTWLPKSTFTLSRRLHYQMVRFLLPPPSLFSCRDVDEEEDWPPDTDRTLTPAPAIKQPQSPERIRRPPVPQR